MQLELIERSTVDYLQAVREALASLGELPGGVKYQGSRYIVRVLWALEIAFRAGLGPLRAIDMAAIICDFGNDLVTGQNVAHFGMVHLGREIW